MVEFVTKLLIGTTLQFVLFIPFFLIWKNDCKEIGRENLAVSLGERFFAWIFICPCWLVIFLR